MRLRSPSAAIFSQSEDEVDKLQESCDSLKNKCEEVCAGKAFLTITSCLCVAYRVFGGRCVVLWYCDGVVISLDVRNE